MEKIRLKHVRYERRNKRSRKGIVGSPERLRLTVFRSDAHIYAQIIDDVTATTIASASTMDPEVRGKIKAGISKVDASKIVGSTLGQRAIAANVKKVAFDRNGFLYHGRVKALAEAARESGLDF
ncbi:MAG: 50S ribosomal protein L18 [Ignavibacteria bacterium]|nr:50S ribosomal protein L18 [Ignavibacteria bacterium]